MNELMCLLSASTQRVLNQFRCPVHFFLLWALGQLLEPSVPVLQVGKPRPREDECRTQGGSGMQGTG